MTIEAKIIADSVTDSGAQITTFVLRYPRFIHSELLTHRDFSRNASSSRAVPIERQIKDIRKDMAMPIEFRRNQKGMQAGAAYGPFGQWLCRTVWRSAGLFAILFAKIFARIGVHKEFSNRILEPFSHISVIVSATAFANFFALRHHSMAQPEIAKLAELMWGAYQNSFPAYLEPGEWHLPFVDDALIHNTKIDLLHQGLNVEWELHRTLIKRSVAMCARVSYMNHLGKHSTLKEDLALYNRLLGSQPIHASPAEHQAQAAEDPTTRSGNFTGWVQYRKLLEGEYITTFSGPLG